MRGLRGVGVIGPNNAPPHVTTVSDVAGDAADTDANAFLRVLDCASGAPASRRGVGLDRAGCVSGGQRPAEPAAHPETSSRDPFLGMVFPTEAHVAYAYATCASVGNTIPSNGSLDDASGSAAVPARR